jgi:hypothetical protein
MGELRFTLKPEKAGQAAAYLLKLSGGSKSKGHLDKMLYAADWSQLRRVGVPITGDQPVSMPQGPVLSGILDLLNGKRSHPFWTKHISQATRDNHLIRLLEEAPTDLLTESEKVTLEKVHARLAGMEWNDLKDYCHKLFTEWEDPGKSQKPIEFETMLLKSGKRKPAFVHELISLQKERQFLLKAFGG